MWVAHIAGWAVLLLLVGCWELATALGPRLTWRALPRAALTAGWRALPVALPLLITLLWRSGHGAETHAFSLLRKTVWVAWLLRSEYRLLDYASLVVLAFAGLWLNGHDKARREWRLLPGALALFLCFIFVPQWVFGSNFTDARLLPVFGMVFFLGLGEPTIRSAPVVATVGIALFTLRLVATTVGWHDRGSAAEADLRVLEQVPRGARIAVLRSESIDGPWVLSGLDHLASLAIIRREAFVNTQWDVAGAQLMRPIYNRNHGFNSSGSGLVDCQSADCGDRLDKVVAGVPRGRFDFVRALGYEAQAPWLMPVASGPDGHLYRIGPSPNSESPAASDNAPLRRR